MPENKVNKFNNRDKQLAEFAKCLSHPARLAILTTLAEKNTCICGEIVNVMPLAQSTVSQHLKELKDAGLIKGEIDGPKSCYCINWDRLNEFNGLLGDFIGKLKKSCNC
ncbi:ArsR/SmtB family transcription factor [Spirochaetota bacterium]